MVKPVQAEELFKLLQKHLQIQWNYKSNALPLEPSVHLEETSASIPSVKLVVPDAEVLIQLLQLVQDGRLNKLAEVVVTLENQEQSYATFVKHILELTGKFQVEELEAFIQQFIH